VALRIQPTRRGRRSGTAPAFMFWPCRAEHGQPRERRRKSKRATKRVCRAAATPHAPACCWRRCQRRQARSARKEGSKPPLQWRVLEVRRGVRRSALQACAGARAALACHFRSADFSLALAACCGCCAQYSCGGAQRQHQKQSQCTYRPDRRAVARRCCRGCARGRPTVAARLQRAAEDVHAAYAAQPGEPTATQSESRSRAAFAWAQRPRRGPGHAHSDASRRRGMSPACVRRRAARGRGRHRPAPSPGKSASSRLRGPRARTALRRRSAQSWWAFCRNSALSCTAGAA